MCSFVTVVSRKRTYKKYLDDPSLPIPKTTRFRWQQSSQSVSSSFPVASLHVPGGDLQEADQSSCPVLPTCIDENVQINMNDFESIGSCETTIDQNANDNAETFDELEPCSAEQFETSGTPLQEENVEWDVSGSENEIGLSTDSESDNDINFSGSETSEEVEDSDVNEDSASEDENDSSQQKTYTAQENACMAILSLISRHCITTEAAKDIIALLKILCPENDTVQSLNYTIVQQVCGNCELYIYDVCERCLALFPRDRENQVICSTLGCNG